LNASPLPKFKKKRKIPSLPQFDGKIGSFEHFAKQPDTEIGLTLNELRS